MTHQKKAQKKAKMMVWAMKSHENTNRCDDSKKMCFSGISQPVGARPRLPGGKILKSVENHAGMPG